MQNDFHRIARAATRLASRLPCSVLESLARAIAENPHIGESALLERLPTAEFRDAGEEFLIEWRSVEGTVTAQVAAAVLLTAATAEVEHQERQKVEPVWTGPDTQGCGFRHTEQAILEVLNSARKRLTVVSFAVYRIPRIREALVAAAHRGVAIRLIVETPNRLEGENEYDCLIALGGNVAPVSTVYFWPQEKRAKDENGKVGILHVKCVVADGQRLFLSSANLTDYAFTINMELGLLLAGGALPEQVERQFDRLIETKVLQKVGERWSGALR